MQLDKDPALQPCTDKTQVLLDVTRLVSRSWTRRRSTGIDRVCYAYLRHLHDTALAVVQHRGIVKTLDPRASRELFDMLLSPSQGFRSKFAFALPRWLAQTMAPGAIKGMRYFNVSHTDFDLPAHWQWVERNGLRSVCLLHDLIPIRYPEYSRPHAVKRHAGRVNMALQRADEIIVSSAAVADDLQSYARANGFAAPRPIIAPLAGELAPRRTCAKPPVSLPYFVSVGTIEPRKNHALLLDIWRQLAVTLGANAPRLILIGQSGPMTGAILDPIAHDPVFKNLVEWRQDCRDEEMSQLVAGASAVLCPSLAEGYGLPLIEALEMHKTVLASDIAIFHEVGQGRPKLLDPQDSGAWAEAIAQLVSDPALSIGMQAAEPFDGPRWEGHFSKLAPILDPPQPAERAKPKASLAA